MRRPGASTAAATVAQARPDAAKLRAGSAAHSAAPSTAQAASAALACPLLHKYSSSAAQTITPVALGFVLDATMAWRTLPVYASILTAASFLVFTLLVKNIKAKKVDHVKGLDALGADD